MEDIRPKGAWYAVYYSRIDDDGKPRKNMKPACVDVIKLAECLPHGSGIDGNWTIRHHLNGDITVHGEYHAMDENGMYCGWRNFRFSLRRCNRTQYHALSGPCAGKYQVTRVKGRVYFDTFVGGGDAKDYLYDTCYFAVADGLGIHSIESGLAVGSEALAASYPQ